MNKKVVVTIRVEVPTYSPAEALRHAQVLAEAVKDNTVGLPNGGARIKGVSVGAQR